MRRRARRTSGWVLASRKMMVRSTTDSCPPRSRRRASRKSEPDGSPRRAMPVSVHSGALGSRSASSVAAGRSSSGSSRRAGPWGPGPERRCARSGWRRSRAGRTGPRRRPGCAAWRPRPGPADCRRACPAACRGRDVVGVRHEAASFRMPGLAGSAPAGPARVVLQAQACRGIASVSACPRGGRCGGSCCSRAVPTAR